MFRIPITFHSFKISGLLANNQNAIQSMSQQSLLLLQRSQSQLPLNQDDYKIDFFKKILKKMEYLTLGRYFISLIILIK